MFMSAPSFSIEEQKRMIRMLFDTHVHLNARQFAEDREETIQRAKDAGVEYMVVVGFDHETIPWLLKSRKHMRIYMRQSAGILLMQLI